MNKPTMSDLSRELGLSKTTISQALRNHPSISLRTRNRVLSAAKRTGYTLNPVVSHLMAELRKSRTPAFHYCIGLLNAYRDRDAFKRHPTIPAYVEGCRRRATAQGYAVDQFWLHDPEVNGRRLRQILQARGIRAVIVIGTMDENHLPDRFAEIWSRHACVVTGVRTHAPTLSFACVDHHALVLQAVEQASRLGYRRPGLVIEQRIDQLVGGRFSAGMWAGQQALPATQRLAPFQAVDRARENPRLFQRWLDQQQPDVIFTLHRVVRRLLENRGLSVPRDIGLIQLERRPGGDDWAGMDQHNDLVGEAAVDMVISQLHNNEIGVPKFPRATLIDASWVPGDTVRPRAPDGARKKGRQASPLA